MSNPSWPDSLRKMILRNPAKARKDLPRIAIIGMGHELRGDDAAGVIVARELQAATAPIKNLLIIDGGAAPENYAAPIRRFQPELALLIDAAQMSAPPGTIRLLDIRAIANCNTTTHTGTPHMLMKYLSAENPPQFIMLGIQPENTELNTGLSPAVEESVRQAVEELREILCRENAD